MSLIESSPEDALDSSLEFQSLSLAFLSMYTDMVSRSLARVISLACKLVQSKKMEKACQNLAMKVFKKHERLYKRDDGSWITDTTPIHSPSDQLLSEFVCLGMLDCG